MWGIFRTIMSVPKNNVLVPNIIMFLKKLPMVQVGFPWFLRKTEMKEKFQEVSPMFEIKLIHKSSNKLSKLRESKGSMYGHIHN